MLEGVVMNTVIVGGIYVYINSDMLHVPGYIPLSMRSYLNTHTFPKHRTQVYVGALSEPIYSKVTHVSSRNGC